MSVLLNTLSPNRRGTPGRSHHTVQACSVVELGGVCSVWETVAKEARGLGKQTIRPFPERWNTLLSEAAAADREAGRLKYDGHKRAAREAQGKRKADLGSVCTNPETNARTRSD